MSRQDRLQTSDPWQALESAWQQESAVDDERSTGVPRDSERHSRQIARLGRRRRWLHRLIVGGEILVCLAFGVGSIFWISSAVFSERVAAIFVLATVLVAGSLRCRAWFDRGPNFEDPPSQFVDSLLTRNAASFRALTFSWILLGVEVLFFLIWLPWSRVAGDLAGSYGFLALWTVGFIVALIMSRRYLEREKWRLERIRSELGDGESRPGRISGQKPDPTGR